MDRDEKTQILKDIFSRNLKNLMDYKNVSVADLARELGLPYMTVSDWYHAKKYPRADKIQRLADFFDISMSDLTEKKPEGYYSASFKAKALIDRVYQMNENELDRLSSIMDLLGESSDK